MRANFCILGEPQGKGRPRFSTVCGHAKPRTPEETVLYENLVKTEYRLRQIPKADILFVEGLKDYVKIYIDGEARPTVSLLSLKSLERNLPAATFMRVHRSFIVNLTKYLP